MSRCVCKVVSEEKLRVFLVWFFFWSQRLMLIGKSTSSNSLEEALRGLVSHQGTQSGQVCRKPTAYWSVVIHLLTKWLTSCFLRFFRPLNLNRFGTLFTIISSTFKSAYGILPILPGLQNVWLASTLIGLIWFCSFVKQISQLRARSAPK